ncbi:hypothetical protein A0H76_575 [Hepatospora eriocheir]|uniref:Uncharacterized protein n=1 Tax=Hepatospora eriocheir TaxID=1081669 RepID=A0A1X0Q822_9MICR|nr:hypothetical protein A0H76_575 [Hepatospora eriocheir]
MIKLTRKREEDTLNYLEFVIDQEIGRNISCYRVLDGAHDAILSLMYNEAYVLNLLRQHENINLQIFERIAVYDARFYGMVEGINIYIQWCSKKNQPLNFFNISSKLSMKKPIF